MKIKDKKIIYIILYIVFILINVFIASRKSIGLLNDTVDLNVKNILFAVLIVFEIVFLIVINIIDTKKIEKIFLALTVPIGICYLLAIPLGGVPDEDNHFKRAYEISQGNLISSREGIDMTTSIENSMVPHPKSGNYQKLVDNLKYKMSDEKENTKFPNTSLYNFVCYLPQTVGIIIGKLLGLPILLVGYLGRIGNFIIWSLLMYLSIKYIPFLKRFVLFLSLLPMTLQEAISLSPDSLTLAICTFLISYTLYVSYVKEKLDKKDYLILAISTIVTSLCKVVYLPVCLILFIIPKEKFKDTKDKYIKIISLALIVIVLNLSWTKIVSPFLDDCKQGVDSQQQIGWIISHPVNYMKVIIDTIIEKREFYSLSMVGYSLQWFTVEIGNGYPMASLIALLFILLIEAPKQIVRKYDKGLSIFILFSVLMLIFTSLYIQWTSPGKNTIDGVQGRYFLPVLILLPLGFIQNKIIKKEKIRDFMIENGVIINKLVATFMLFFDLIALFYIFILNF